MRSLNRVTRMALAVAAAGHLMGCAEAACTLAGGESGVLLDATNLGLPMDTGVEVCLGSRCVPLGWSEQLNGQGESAVTSFLVDTDSNRRPTMSVRRADGSIVAGPHEVVLEDTYPNGESCPPALLTAQLTATPDGEFEPQNP